MLLALLLALGACDDDPALTAPMPDRALDATLGDVGGEPPPFDALPLVDVDRPEAGDADPDPSAACATLLDPEELETPAFIDRGPCPGGHVVRLRAPVGMGLRARIIPLDAAPDAAVELWWPERADWIRADRVELADTVELAWVAPLEGAAIKVDGDIRWRMAVEREPQETEQIVVQGAVDASERRVTENGLGGPRLFTAAGARIDLLDGAGRLLDITRVDDTNGYTLVANAPPGERTVRFVAETVADGVPIRVGPDGELPWAFPIPAKQGDVARETFIDAAEPAAGAWFIARIAGDGFEALRPWLPLDVLNNAPPVRIRWRPGFSEPCGSCFRPGPRPLIDLGGRVSDPDEWDRAVILHELGHYIAAVFSRDDSGGGPHDGTPIAPDIAWSEGLATYLASWPDAPIQLDYKLAGVALLDLEEMAQPEAFGTADGSAVGDISERLVAAVLWDIHDDPLEDDDRLFLRDDRIFGALFYTLTRDWPDQGAPGIDLLDFVGALWCDGPIDGLRDVLEARELPHTPRCRRKGPGPLHARRLGDDRFELHSTVGGTLTVGAEVYRIAPGQRITVRPPPGTLGATLDHASGRDVVGFVEEQSPALRLVRRAGAWEVQR